MSSGLGLTGLFAALLGTSENGRWLLTAVDDHAHVAVERRYVGHDDRGAFCAEPDVMAVVAVLVFVAAAAENGA